MTSPLDPESLSQYFSHIGRAGGLAAARAMTPEQRQKRARACAKGRAAARKRRAAEGKPQKMQSTPEVAP